LIARADRRRLVRFYERVAAALRARPAAGAFNLNDPIEAAAVGVATTISVQRQHEGHAPDFAIEVRLGAELMSAVALATSIPREDLAFVKGTPDGDPS
jgi:NAD dependent epimerase/dehydratase family enzyme